MDAKHRNLVYTDKEAEDTHPDVVATKQRFSDSEKWYLQRNADERDLAAMETLIHRAKTIRSSTSRISTEQKPQYRTHRGVTTRPFGPRALVEKADAFDWEQRKNAEDQRLAAGNFQL